MDTSPKYLPPDVLLERLYGLKEKPSRSEAIDLIIENIDEYCWASRFDLIDELLSKADMDRLGQHLVIYLVIFGRWGEKNMKGYKAFRDAAYQWYSKQIPPEELERLFMGLKD